MSRISVLIVDDSAVVRTLVEEALNADAQIHVVGQARNGQEALDMIRQNPPDLVTLDVEMPVLDGLSALRILRKTNTRLPVIMFSTMTHRGGTATIDALSSGANDYVTKPESVRNPQEALLTIREQLIPKIKSLCKKKLASPKVGTVTQSASRNPHKLQECRGTRRVDLLAIGVSTGGPEALGKLLSAIPANLPVPVVLVQHMPPLFTRILAERLDQNTSLHVHEAVNGEGLKPGVVYIAPGDYHMKLVREKTSVQLCLDQGPQENSCRPAVDVLFRSAAELYGPRCLAVVLTGMGQDGMLGARQIVDAGGVVLAQDEATSVVWGMPGAIARAGLAQAILPLEELAPRIMDKVATGRLVVIN